MTDEQRAAYIFASAVRAMARIEGMKALNTEREANNYALAYNENAFNEVIEEEGISHNQIILFFNN